MTYAAPSDGMPDPMVLSSVTTDMQAAWAFNGAAGQSATWSTANRAKFIPVRLTQARTYVRAFWLNGSAASGNVDVGIYTYSGGTLTRIVASVAEAQGTVSTMQVAASFAPTTIGPGLYYLAMSCSSATATSWICGPANTGFSRGLGCLHSTTSHPLPSTVTAIAASTTAQPVFGFAESTAL